MRFLCGALSSSAIQDGVHDDGEHAEGNAAHGHALRTSCVGKQGVHVRECTLTAHSVPRGSAPCRASTPPVKHPAAALFTLSCLARTWPARTIQRDTSWGGTQGERRPDSHSLCSADLLDGALRAGEQHAHGAEPFGIGPEETAGSVNEGEPPEQGEGTRQDLRAAERADACAV